MTSSAVSQRVGDLVFLRIRCGRIPVLFFGLVAVLLLTAGCFFDKSGKDTNTPAAPQVGVVDVDRAVQSHPQYQQLLTLQQQYNALAAKLEAARSAAAGSEKGGSPMTGADQPASMPDAAVNDGLHAALEQEFQAKMTGKQTELNAALKAKAAALHAALNTELQEYTAALDKEYQPNIFDIQLKLKTVRLSETEMTSLQSELDRLQNEKSGKIAEKERQLAARFEQQMAPEQTAAGQQLDQYARQLQDEMAQKANAQSADIMSRNQPASLPSAPVQIPSSSGTGNEDEQLLAAKQREVENLRQVILDDIRDKAGKVAAERGLEAVFANVSVNASAVDITDAVIASFTSAAVRLQG